MLLRLATMFLVSATLLTSAAPVFAETILTGPYHFTNDIPFSYPQFATSSGYLHSISFVVTNCTLQMDLIVDNDSTNSVALDTTFGQFFFLIQDLDIRQGGIHAIIFNVDSFLQGTFASLNDGDSRQSYDGGEDEIMLDVSHADINQKTIVTRAACLVSHTGLGHNSVSIHNDLVHLMNHSITAAWPIDIFVSNLTYTGELYVQYGFEPFPLQPAISRVNATNGNFEIGIENLSFASSNRIQRSSNLRSNDWIDIQTFISDSWEASRSIALSNEWDNAFYRVLSE